MIYEGYAEPYDAYGEALEDYAEPYEGYGEVIDGYGEAPWWRPQYNFQVRNPLYPLMRPPQQRPWWSWGPQGWQRPGANYPGAPPDRRLYLRCSAWRGPSGMVPGPGMPLATALPPGAPGAPGTVPGMPGAPGMPGGWGGGRRRRRRRR